jgi:hypothetical protein
MFVPSSLCDASLVFVPYTIPIMVSSSSDDDSEDKKPPSYIHLP